MTNVIDCSRCQDALLTSAPSNARTVAVVDAHCRGCTTCADLADAVQWQTHALATQMNEYSSSRSPYALAEYARTASSRPRPWGSRAIVLLLGALLVTLTVRFGLENARRIRYLAPQFGANAVREAFRPKGVREEVVLLQCLTPDEAADVARSGNGSRDLAITIKPRATRTLSITGPDISRAIALEHVRALDRACQLPPPAERAIISK